MGSSIQGNAMNESGLSERGMIEILRSQKPSTLVSLAILAFVGLACLAGPWLLPHSYDRVYRDYVLAGPSLAAHPNSDELDMSLAATARRIHAEISSYKIEGDTLHLTLKSDAPIDPRVTRYFDHSDLFGTARIVGETTDDHSLKLDLPIRHTYFLFGTDANGRDLLTRTLIAGRISLAVGILASLVALIVGVAWGATAGYLGGNIDTIMMRAVEIIYALPFIFLVIVLVVIFGRNFVLIFVAIGAVEWLDMARIVRGQTLSIKRRDYVAAAEALGATAPAILWRHIIPNAAGPITAYLTVLVPRVILLESFVSFLGLGVQEPLTSWGILIADGARNIQASIHLLIFPALFLGLTLAALNQLGENWRERLGAGGA
jgi:oligopeptide transport system permease protein